jgi:hypothetical protein
MSRVAGRSHYKSWHSHKLGNIGMVWLKVLSIVQLLIFRETLHGTIRLLDKLTMPAIVCLCVLQVGTARA